MKTTILKLSASVLIFALMGIGCKKKEEKEMKNVSITLYDKPLSVVQKYTTGKWKFQYSFGGFSVHKIINTDSSYMILNSSHITMGNNMGIIVDNKIVWTKTEVGENTFTYMFSFPDYSTSYIVDQIKNDTLIIREYASDGFRYYYTKN